MSQGNEAMKPRVGWIQKNQSGNRLDQGQKILKYSLEVTIAELASLRYSCETEILTEKV